MQYLELVVVSKYGCRFFHSVVCDRWHLHALTSEVGVLVVASVELSRAALCNCHDSSKGPVSELNYIELCTLLYVKSFHMHWTSYFPILSFSF